MGEPCGQNLQGSQKTHVPSSETVGQKEQGGEKHTVGAQRIICVLHPLKIPMYICMYAFLYIISIIKIYWFLCFKKHLRIIAQQDVYCSIIAKIVKEAFSNYI